MADLLAQARAALIGVYHRTHPVTGFEFDYERACKSCAHFTVRTRRKVEQVCCALAPELDGETFGGQRRAAFPACEAWQQVMTPVKRPRKRR